MAEVGTDDERDEGTQIDEREDNTRMGHGCPETHANEKGEIGPRLPGFDETGRGVFI